jgi:hypothetical protein
MLKKLLIAAAMTGLAGALMAIQTSPTMADRANCRQIAKAEFPGDRSARRAFKRECKARLKGAHGGKRGLFRGAPPAA